MFGNAAFGLLFTKAYATITVASGFIRCRRTVLLLLPQT